MATRAYLVLMDDQDDPNLPDHDRTVGDELRNQFGSSTVVYVSKDNTPGYTVDLQKWKWVAR